MGSLIRLFTAYVSGPMTQRGRNDDDYRSFSDLFTFEAVVMSMRNYARDRLSMDTVWYADSNNIIFRGVILKL
jgi:hypothetical protein